MIQLLFSTVAKLNITFCFRISMQVNCLESMNFIKVHVGFGTFERSIFHMEQNITQLQYPIGQFEAPATINDAPIETWIRTIATFPSNLRSLVEGLNDEHLDTPYRPGGWTIRQVVHHVGDSHMNSYIRFKWTLTEEKPLIKAYYEDRWAELPDSKGDIVPALALVEALHSKWVSLLKHISEQDLHRSFVHPETKKEVPLWVNIGLYDWHCKHHLGHISGLLERKEW